MNRILLLGANGQVGWELQRALAPLGELLVCDRRRADLADPEGLARLVRAERPQFIVNAGAYTAVDKAESDADNARLINARAVAVLAEEAAACGAWLVRTHRLRVRRRGQRAFRRGRADRPAERLRADQAGRRAGHPRQRLPPPDLPHQLGLRRARRELRQDHAAPGRATRRTQGRGRPVRRADQRRADRRRHRPGPAASALGRRAGSTGQRHLPPGRQRRTSWHLYARFVIEQALERGWELQATPQRVLPITTEDYPVPAKRPANSRLDNRKLQQVFGLVLPDWRYHAGRMIQELSEQGPL